MVFYRPIASIYDESAVGLASSEAGLVEELAIGDAG
jgi:hypothetical protein